MKLKLLSDAEAIDEFVKDFGQLLNLDDSKLKYLIKNIFLLVTDEIDDKKIASDLGVEEGQVSALVGSLVFASGRILSGIKGSDVEQDLVKNGFPESKVKLLFSTVEALPEEEKTTLRYYSLNLIADRSHPNWASIGTNLVIRSILDNGNIIGVIPRSILKIRLSSTSDDEKEETVFLELEEQDLKNLIRALEDILRERVEAGKALKSKFGDLLLEKSGK